MGQKVNPVGLRLGINRTWDSRWYAKKSAFGRALEEDMRIRQFVCSKLPQAGISKVVIERSSKKVAIFIHTARPGIVIGKRGSDIEKLRKQLVKMAGCEISLNIVEIRKPEIDAQLVAENLAQQLEKRISFRRAMKRSLQSAMKIGALGIRINCSGRLGGAEIARMEWYRDDLDTATSRDPFPKLKTELLKKGFAEKELSKIKQLTQQTVATDYQKALKAEDPKPEETAQNEQ